MRCILAVVVIVACSGETKPPPPETKAAAAPDPAKPTTRPVAPADAPPPLLGDLPALELAELPVATIEASVKLNTAGYKLHTANQYADAATQYIAAIKLDPGNLLARYNLASVWSSAGEDAKALAVLAQLRKPDCRPCVGLLIHARTDREWSKLKDDVRFKAIVDGVTAMPFDPLKVTKLVIHAIQQGKADDALAPFVHPRTPIKVSDLFYGPPEQAQPPRLVYGWKEFVDYARAPTRIIEEDLTCTKTCCKTGIRGDSVAVVDRVCFAGYGGVLFVSSIDIDNGIGI